MPKRQTNFRSKLEKEFGDQLRACKADHCYESCKLPYVLERKYVPDFTVRTASGKTIYLEVKGYLRPADRTKMVAVKKQNPGADIRFLFARNQLVRGTQMMYSDWCKKYGFPYAFEKIPKRWLK